MSNPRVKHKTDLTIAKEFVATMKRRGLNRTETFNLIDEADRDMIDEEVNRDMHRNTIIIPSSHNDDWTLEDNTTNDTWRID